MKSNTTTTTLLTLAMVSGSMVRSGFALSDSEIAAKEAKITVSAAADENAALKEKILLQQNTIQGLTDGFTKAASQAEAYKREAADLRMKIETLGLAATDRSGAKLQERLLAAVNDLRLAQRSQQEMRDQVVRLSESILALLKASDKIDFQLRMSVESELRSTNEMLTGDTNGAQAEKATGLTDAAIVDVKEDLSLVVANVGKKQDVRMGMPFQIIRNNQVIGEVLVVDVRDRICGAVVQNLASEKQRIQIGDRLKVEARQ